MSAHRWRTKRARCSAAQRRGLYPKRSLRPPIHGAGLLGCWRCGTAWRTGPMGGPALAGALALLLLLAPAAWATASSDDVPPGKLGSGACQPQQVWEGAGGCGAGIGALPDQRAPEALSYRPAGCLGMHPPRVPAAPSPLPLALAAASAARLSGHIPCCLAGRRLLWHLLRLRRRPGAAAAH